MSNQTIYGLLHDNGDGSTSMHWFRTHEEVDAVLDQDALVTYEAYWTNDGPSEVLHFPEDLDLESCGFVFQEIELEEEEQADDNDMFS
jgi:hypothetical protein